MINTNTKTFGKESKSMVKELFPTAKSVRVHGKNKMKQFINFYDADQKHLGYWTNEQRENGVFRIF